MESRLNVPTWMFFLPSLLSIFKSTFHLKTLLTWIQVDIQSFEFLNLIIKGSHQPSQ